MSTSSASMRSSDRRSSMATETFKTFTASSSRPEESRLQQSRHIFKGTSDNIATSISPSGWLATASSKQVFLYNVKGADRSRKITLQSSLPMKLLKDDVRIRAVALSEDLLAVATESRLLVYQNYKTSCDRVEERAINRDETWMPSSIAILQNSVAERGHETVASIAVGGVSEHGVKVFRYTYNTAWGPQKDQATLRCPGNMGAIKTVGLLRTQYNAALDFIAFALTDSNCLYSWRVVQSLNGRSKVFQPIWCLDCNPLHNHRVYKHEISSAYIFESPTKRLYVFCAVDHKRGSHLPSSFVVPMDIGEDPLVLRHRMKSLPESVAGKNVLAGAASTNGQFLVLVEKEQKTVMKVLALEGATMGGLTCSTRILSWETDLEGGIGTDASSISISIEEQFGALEIIAVDGRGHVAFSRVTVDDMPTRESLQPRIRMGLDAIELPSNARMLPEMSA